jgi:CheY-like chemotaxis protein
MHGGIVEATSDGIGQGATFTVRLPVRRLDLLPGLDRAAPNGKDGLHNAVVLLVDDDEDALAVMDAALKSHGAVPLRARSAAEALRLVDAYLPDAVVSDIAMPGEDGYTLMTLLKQRLGAAMPAVAVAVTAYASERDRSRAMSAGYNVHLSKPVDPDVLLDTLSELIGEAQPLRPSTTTGPLPS